MAFVREGSGDKSGRYGRVVKIIDKKKSNKHLVHVLKTVKISWVKNFCQVFLLRDKKKNQLSKHQGLLTQKQMRRKRL